LHIDGIGSRNLDRRQKLLGCCAECLQCHPRSLQIGMWILSRWYGRHVSVPL
jgi:hypothetical protein